MWKALLMVTAAVFAFAACGGGDDDDEVAATATPTEPAATATSAAPDPAELGEAIGDLYVQAIADVVALLKDRPEPGDARADLEALKESYITRLVEMGRQKETLSAAEKATVNGRLLIGINSIPSADYAAYSDTVTHYRSVGDQEFADLVTDFNVITQYADFELLKQQEPDEAARLGIE